MSRASLERTAPPPVEIGAGAAVVLEGGWEGAAAPGAQARIGGASAPLGGMGVSSEDGGRRWWSVVPVPSGTPAGRAPIEAGGEEVGTTELAAGGAWSRPAAGIDPEAIAICMATHEPPPDRLRRQIDSIRAQTWTRWSCVISDDGSSPEAFAEIERIVGDDPRFTVSRSPSRLGFLRNFERAIRLAPPEAGLIALCDQDDRWFPDKLEALVGTLRANPDAALAYSDMRITDGEGRVLSDTFWYLRRNRCDDMVSMLVTNTVTGAASLFRRELLADALPLPPAHPTHAMYHDHWLALCALATGEIAYLDRPTYDYYRYDDSVTVREAPDWVRPRQGFAGRLRVHWGRVTRRIRMGSGAPTWEQVYRRRWLMLEQLVTMLELRLGDRIGTRHRRGMRRLMRAERSPLAAAWLLLRCLRPLLGRNETLARERVLFGGLLWRWTRGRNRG